ncbi:putative GspL periplasmic domain containing protein [Desulfosarcina cetonica]|uniref:type II secretion system protein GspL n=1 Tax=Desulfosarcina cetonica TaxID=90730 RepID=UPI0006CF7BEF|nr:type II secretion system protein GspL [Desulfosarcina cetonica]VTR65128.1 putative GspL periplasmic domain containing protein [Desulfosarcina cetonica]
MSRKVLGLEIRAAAVAAVLLDSSFKGSVIEAQAFVPIPADGTDDGLREALETLVDAIHPAGAACVLGIPTDALSFRNLSLPFSDLKKIRQVLPFELEPSLPLPVDELSFDFEAVKREGQYDLLAFTMPKRRIAEYLTLLNDVGLRPLTVVPGAYVAARCMMLTAPEKEDFVYIDTGDGHHAAYAICEGHVRMVRSLPVATGGNPLVRHLETALERTYIAARDSLGIDFNPKTVFSGGPEASLIPASDSPSGLLGLPVRTTADLRTFHRLKGDFDAADWQTGRLDTALALALNETEGLGGVNFSTERSSVQHYWSEYRGQIIFSAVLVLITLITALAGQMVTAADREKRVAELDHRIETVFKQTFPDVTRVVNPLQQMQVKIREASDAGAGPDLPGSRVRVIDILNALSQQIPKTINVDISRLVLGADNVVLSATTDTFNTVNDIKGHLEKADIFKNVTISSADLEKSGQRVRFKLKLDF